MTRHMTRHLVSHVVGMAGKNLASEEDQDTLYRLIFIGGPFDGHEADWQVLPEACVKLYSAEAAKRATKSGLTTAPRGVLYELKSSKLCSPGPAPFVLLRYTYRETRELPSRSAWNRCLLWVRMLWSDPRSPVDRTRDQSRRSSVHVQD
jgi:hypothetical protein